MARPWLRLYRKIVESMKVHDLRPELFKPWVMLLACTDDDGNLPSVSQLAFKLRQSETRIEAWLIALVNLRFIDKTATGYIAHDWTDWNFDSDVSTERVKRFREQQRNALDTDTDSEGDKEPTLKRGTRLVEGFEIPDQWLNDGQESRIKAGLNVIDLGHEAREFVAHFTGADCKQPVKKDWHSAWLRWCRNARGKPNGRSSGQSGAIARIAGKVQAAREDEARRSNLHES